MIYETFGIINSNSYLLSDLVEKLIRNIFTMYTLQYLLSADRVTPTTSSNCGKYLYEVSWASWIFPGNTARECRRQMLEHFHYDYIPNMMNLLDVFCFF